MVHFLELERLIWPTLSLLTTFVSGLLFLISMATPAWFRIDIFLSNQAVGNITAGLIQGREIIQGDTGLLVDVSFYTFQRFNNVISLTSLYILIVCLVLTIPASLANMAFEFVNTYQVVKEWWRGPATIYVFSLLVVILAALSTAVYVDFYTIDLSDPIIKQQIINSSRTDVNLEKYTGVGSTQYSAYIFFVGAGLCILPLLFSWRLTVLLPVFYTTDVLIKHKYDIPDKIEMEVIEEGEEDEDDEEEEEEEEDQFIMAERPIDSNEESKDSDESKEGSSDEINSDEEDEDEEEDEEEDDELDDYHYPTERQVTAGGYLTYQ